MKTLFFLMTFSCLANHNLPSDDIMKVSEIVQAFSKSADSRNIQMMGDILHDDFRAIVNQAFGSQKVDFIDKGSYLDLMDKKVIGGDNRNITILSVDMEGNNAVVKVKLEGKELVFMSFMQLVKDPDGEWKVMSDMPTITKLD